MDEYEYKHWCGNCQIRIYIQRHYGRILTWQNCPYSCEYATAMRCSTRSEGESVMTNAEAIETLRANYPDACYEQLREAVDVAIEALNAQGATGDTISRQAAIDELMCLVKQHECDLMPDLLHWTGVKAMLESLPSAQPEWNNHTVACLLADMFGDSCACNFNGIDEWLPEKCDFAETCCPYPVGVACWEQYLKHRAERRTNE